MQIANVSFALFYHNAVCVLCAQRTHWSEAKLYAKCIPFEWEIDSRRDPLNGRNGERNKVILFWKQQWTLLSSSSSFVDCRCVYCLSLRNLWACGQCSATQRPKRKRRREPNARSKLLNNKIQCNCTERLSHFRSISWSACKRSTLCVCRSLDRLHSLSELNLSIARNEKLRKWTTANAKMTWNHARFVYKLLIYHLFRTPFCAAQHWFAICVVWLDVRNL